MNLILSLILLILISRGISGTTFTIINKCDKPIWPGILGNSQLDTTGFELQPGGSSSVQAPPGWSGRFWARTGCNFDPLSGQGSCSTGDCGSDQVECSGSGPNPPVTLAEFTIGSGTPDFYDVSLVDGYNLPMIVEPVSRSGSCRSTGCPTDLNSQCPTELQADDGQACMSACEAFGSPEYCCSGTYNTPNTCQPSMYSQMFKSACPMAYSYAYDDATSTFTCMGGDYWITFCPSATSQKSSTDSSPPPPANTTSGSGFGPGAGPGSTPPPTIGPGFGSGSFNNPGIGSSSWFPNFVIGGSSRAISSFSLRSILFMIMINFLVLYLHCL